MSARDLATVALYLAVLTTLAYPLGGYLARMAAPEPLGGTAGRIERLLMRLALAGPGREMTWTHYATALLSFNALGFAVVYAVQRLQAWLPFNPQRLGNVPAASAFNTAVSFVTNTNWQAYAGETTMGYFTQMSALSVQNFLSAATGMSVAFALLRGFARRAEPGIGNFWVDVTRSTVFVLLPVSVLVAVLFMSQGVIQNLSAYVPSHPLEHAHAVELLPMGPVASQEAIKMVGTNGGGFFNANSAHPYENPTPLSNFVQMISMLLIPAALCFTFGRMVADARQGWAIFAAMATIFVVMAVIAVGAESQGNPSIGALGIDQSHSMLQAGGNMEGKETRFGTAASALFAAVTTAASCGAVNAMHDSFTPLGGMVPLWLMQLGEVVFGGVGSGIYGMLIFAILAVFVAGLMIGRTPEYIGKKIESYEIKMTSIAILVTPLLTLTGTALAVMLGAGRGGIFNPGAHGFTEVLYALSSAANNNGSAFAGLSADSGFYDVLLGAAMWFGRFALIVPVLAIAGSLARKKRIEPTAGTLPTHGPLFVALLIGTVVLVGALTYLPSLALGPVAEHLRLHSIHPEARWSVNP